MKSLVDFLSLISCREVRSSPLFHIHCHIFVRPADIYHLLRFPRPFFMLLDNAEDLI